MEVAKEDGGRHSGVLTLMSASLSTCKPMLALLLGPGDDKNTTKNKLKFSYLASEIDWNCWARGQVYRPVYLTETAWICICGDRSHTTCIKYRKVQKKGTEPVISHLLQSAPADLQLQFLKQVPLQPHLTC